MSRTLSPSQAGKALETTRKLWQPAAEPQEGWTPAQFHTAKDAIARSKRAFDAVTVTCGHCRHFSLGACELHGEVPAEFQKTEDACEDWRFDAIPF